MGRRLPPALRETGLIFLITRGALFLLAPLAYLTLPKMDPAAFTETPLLKPELTHTFAGPAHYLFDIWARWDAVWYLQIAAHGYAAHDYSTAFFPLYPLFIAMFKPLFAGNGVLAGIFVSLGFCLAAFYFLYRLVEIDFGRQAAGKAVFYLAIFPTSLFFQAIYSESLFLALSIGCLLAARRRDYVIAGIAGALATLTRSAGLLLLLPLFIMYMQERDWRFRDAGWDMLYLLLVPLGLGVWMLFLGIRFGDPFIFTEAQSFWLREFTGPLAGLWEGFKAAFRGVETLFNTPDDLYWTVIDQDSRLWSAYDIINLGFTLTFLGLCVAAFRKLPLAYAVYALAVIIFPLSYASSTVPLFSMPRFLLTAFPIFILLGIWGARNRWLDMTVTVFSLAFLGFFTAKFVVWTWVA
ncbi:mannosyltransferase [bacterium BMS3Abin01]|nr:mannosyltransferase [bacterium BMS3Abin01]HDY69916.1 hypothetical protein [Actinomycetota bacterium]